MNIRNVLKKWNENFEPSSLGLDGLEFKEIDWYLRACL
jgi:hypothetical protein